MKKLLFSILTSLLLLILSGCCLSHEWQAATCTEPSTCTKCGETYGESLGHLWTAATCEHPQTCSICNATEGTVKDHIWIEASCLSPKKCAVCGAIKGDPLDHIWIEATCTEPQRCDRCGVIGAGPTGHILTDPTCTEPQKCTVCGTSGLPAVGHTWIEATCTTPQTCAVCNATEGLPTDHSVEKWEIIQSATCTEKGKETGFCTECQQTIERDIDLAEHKEGKWTIAEEATVHSSGRKAVYCTVCGRQLKSEAYSLTNKEMEQAYGKMCKSVSYNNLSRNPSDYVGEYIKFSGYVLQVCSEASSGLYYSSYRVSTSGRYDNVVMIKVDNYGKERILEDDHITFYGTYDGLYTYTTIFGATNTIPCITVEYYK